MSEADPRAACLRWLAGREHSRAELAHKLLAKGFDPAAIAATLDGLAQDGLQDESRFVESYVRSQFGKGHGPGRIRQELKLRGIDEQGLMAVLNEYDWDGALARVHAKKFGPAAPATTKDYAARVRFLSGRGFALDRVQALLRHLRPAGDEPDTLNIET